MSATADTNRTHYEVLMDIRYNTRLNELHKRLYARLQGVVTVLAVLGLTGAISAVTGNLGDLWFVVTAVVLAVVSAINAWCNFGAQAVVFGYMQRQFRTLAQRSHGLSAEQLDAAMLDIDDSALNYIEGLRMPAYNQNLRSYGHEAEVRPLGRWERFMQALA